MITTQLPLRLNGWTTGEGGFVNKEILDAMPAVEETQYVRHVRFEHPMRILMDGKKQEGAVLIPKE